MFICKSTKKIGYFICNIIQRLCLLIHFYLKTYNNKGLLMYDYREIDDCFNIKKIEALIMIK